MDLYWRHAAKLLEDFAGWQLRPLGKLLLLRAAALSCLNASSMIRHIY